MTQHFALVQESEKIQLPVDDAPSDSVHNSLLRIYRRYASLFPNPRLIEERCERDRLLQASSAALNARKSNQPKTKSNKSWLGFLWGSSTKEQPPSKVPIDRTSDDAKLVYTEIRDEEYTDDSLCGTKYSLDLSCIPEEAHSMARFHLASMRSRGDRPNVARQEWDRLGSCVVVITGLGEIVEYRDNKASRQYTSDRRDLVGFREECGSDEFQVAYARAALIGPNLLIVSWGLSDGYVMFYRRLKGEQDVRWEAVATLGPSEQVLHNIGNIFVEESGSASLRVSDIVPLVVETGDIPAATLAVSRLGGSIELIPLPPRMWYGPELQPHAKKRPNRKEKQLPPDHYVVGKLPDLAATSGSVVTLFTKDIQTDLLGLEPFRTRVADDTAWDRQKYPNTPPSEYILAAYGVRHNCQIVAFWAVSILFGGKSQSNSNTGFTVHASLTEVIDIGELGLDVSVFIDEEIMKYWRQPRTVELHDANNKEQRNESNVQVPAKQVSTLTLPVPIISARFSTEHDAAYLALLDWNGGVTIIDCTLLERTVSQTLSEEEYQVVYQNHESDNIFPLATAIVDRSHFKTLLASEGIHSMISDVRWLQVDLHGDQKPIISLISDCPGYVHVASLKDLSTCNFLMSAHFEGWGALLPKSGKESILALVVSDFKMSLFFSSVKRLIPEDIVKAMFDEGKYAEAIEASRDLDDEGRTALVSLIDECRKELWKRYQNVEILRGIHDTHFIVEETLNCDVSHLAETFTISDLRSLLLLSIDSAKHTASVEGHATQSPATLELRGRLLKLGTYELLCRHYSIETNIVFFFSDFLPASMSELCMLLAQSNDLVALSVVYFRHIGEIKKCSKLFDCIALADPPSSYCHLLPVFGQATSFVAHNDGAFYLSEIIGLPKYLSERWNAHITLDQEDEMAVFEYILNDDGNGINNWSKDEFIHWYTSRLTLTDESFPCLEHLLDLGIVAGLVLGSTETKTADDQGFLSQAEALNRNARILQDMADGIVLSIELSDFGDIIENLEGLQNLSTVDMLGLFSKCHRDSKDLFGFIRRMADNWKASAAVKDTFGAVISDFVREQFEALRNATEISQTINGILRTLEIIVSVASIIRLSLNESICLVRDENELFEFVISASTILLKQFPGESFAKTVKRQIVDGLWAAYESLPIRTGITDDTSDALIRHDHADALYAGLVVLDIVANWPVEKFSEVFFRIFESFGTDMVVQSAQSVVSLMRDSFQEQVEYAFSTTDKSEHGIHDLFLSLLSDISAISAAVRIEEYGKDLSTFFSKTFFTWMLKKDLVDLSAEYIGWLNLDTDCADVANAILAFQGSLRESIDRGEYSQQIRVLLKCERVFRGNMKISKQFASTRKCFEASQLLDSALARNCCQSHFNLETIRALPPIDVIDQILSTNPALICDRTEWDDVELAMQANGLIRLQHTNNHDGKVQSPPLPGETIFRLAEILGLVDKSSVVAVKYLIIWYGLRAGFHGASAAICRGLLMNESDDSLSALIITSVSLVVGESRYDDHETKAELLGLLFLSNLNLKTKELRPLTNAILEFSKCVYDIRLPSASGSPYHMNSSFENLHEGVMAVQNVDVLDISRRLSSLLVNGTTDDSILDALGRNTALWCMDQTTTRNSLILNQVQQEDLWKNLEFQSSIVMHIVNENIRQTHIQDMQNTFSTQLKRIQEKRMDVAGVPTTDREVLRRLMGRGYSENGARRAIIMTHNKGFDAALQWAVSHSLDHDFDSPMVFLRKNEGCVDFGRIQAVEHVLLRLSEAIKLDDFSLLFSVDRPLLDNAAKPREEMVEKSAVETDSFPSFSSLDANFDEHQEVVSEPKVSRINTEQPTLLDTTVQRMNAKMNEGAPNEQNSTPTQNLQRGTLPQDVADQSLDEKQALLSPSRPFSSEQNVEKPNEYPTDAQAPSIVQSYSSAVSDHSFHKERGQAILNPVKKSPVSPGSDERRRLIEEGRRLLQRARTGKNVTVERTHRYPLRSTVAREATSIAPGLTQHSSTSEQENGLAKPDTPISPGPVASNVNTAMHTSSSDGWDFDDDF